MNISPANVLMAVFVAATAAKGYVDTQAEKAAKADPYNPINSTGRFFVASEEKAPIVGGLPRAFYGLVNLVKNVALAAINKAVSLVRKDNAQFVTVRWEAAKLDAQNIKQGLAQLIPSYFKKQA